MLGKARAQPAFDIAVVAKTADGDSWNSGDRAQLHHELDTCSVRQSNIAEEQVELVTDCGFHGRADAASRNDQMAAANEQFLESSARVLVIVHEENFQSVLPRFTGSFGRDSCCFSS